MAHSVEEINKHVKSYLVVFGALLGLTLLTVAVSYLDVAIGWAVFIGLLVATAKGSLVAAVFMHLKDDFSKGRRWVSWTFLLTLFFFAFMIVVMILTEANSTRL